MMNEWQIDDYMEKALVFQAKGGKRYNFFEYLVDTELKLLRKNGGGIGKVFKKSELEESIKRRSHEQLQIKKPRTVLVQKRQQIGNPLPLMEEDGFKKAVEDKMMGFLGPELRKIEEEEKRSREEILVVAEILISLKNATPPLRAVCDQKKTTVEMPISSSSSHPQPEQKENLKRNRDSSLLLPLQSTPPEMPVKIHESIKLLGGTTPVWLTHKILTNSDVRGGQGRLFIPTCEALEQFMTDEEKKTAFVEKKKKAFVEKKKKQIKNKESGREEKKKEVGLNVILVHPMGDWQEVSFRKWGSLKKCVFTKTWKSLCKRFNLLPSELKPRNEKHYRDMVQLWCFRLPVERDSKLCFAINIIKNIIVQLGDKKLYVDQSRQMTISNCIEPSFDNFEARPFKKHCSSKLNSHESPELIEALPLEEYRAVAAKAEKE